MAARLRLDSEPGSIRQGRVQSVATAGEQDQQSRLTTFPVVIALNDTAEAAWINVPAQVEIVIGVRENVLLVPDGCVRSTPGGQAQVTLQDGSTFRAQPVEIGVADADRVEIRSGLAAGQTLSCR
jgi:multidrug efflux pump subunit AcrA (membrane-fusion protein)